MAKQKTDWQLAKLGSDGFISTKVVELKVKVKNEDKDKKPDEVKGTTVLIGRIVNLPKAQEAFEAIINKGEKDETKHTHLTHEFLLADYINENISLNFKQYLRVKANPKAAVAAAIARLKLQFPKLPEDKLAAMANMMIDSMKQE